MQDKKFYCKKCGIKIEYSGRGRYPLYCEECSKEAIKDRKNLSRQRDKDITKQYPEFEGRIKFEDGKWQSISAKHSKESLALWNVCMTLELDELPILVSVRRKKLLDAKKEHQWDDVRELQLQIRVIQDVYLFKSSSRSLEDDSKNWMFDYVDSDGNLKREKVDIRYYD